MTTCEFLMVDHESVSGFRCGNWHACHEIDKISSDCPIVEYARELESAYKGRLSSNARYYEFKNIGEERFGESILMLMPKRGER